MKLHSHVLEVKYPQVIMPLRTPAEVLVGDFYSTPVLHSTLPQQDSTTAGLALYDSMRHLTSPLLDERLLHKNMLMLNPTIFQSNIPHYSCIDILVTIELYLSSSIPSTRLGCPRCRLVSEAFFLSP